MTIEINHETKEKLRQYIEAIEQKEDEKQDIQSQIKEMFDGAKAEGFDVKAMKSVIRIRKMDQSQLEQEEYLLETYKDALDINN